MRRLFKLALISTLFIPLTVIVLLSLAKVGATDSGAHARLRIPVGKQSASFQIYSGTGEHVIMPGFLDGPVVRSRNAGGWSATWYCENQRNASVGQGRVLSINCAGRSHRFNLQQPPVFDADAPMPATVAVISDLEGNLRFLNAALSKLGVTDAGGDWQFANNHLVVLGDSVDRGREAFAVLWRLHGLALQAHAAGGAVHVVLGNHEQYVLRGNYSRTHPDHRYAVRQMGGFERAFSEETIIGAWLRAQPVALRLGRTLFVHGGVSPEVAANVPDVDSLNGAMRNFWGSHAGSAARSKAFDAVLSHQGVTQYRGYFEAMDGMYPQATQADLEAVVRHFDVDRIVVGHTLVERIQRSYNGRVIAVDVNDDEARREVLVFHNGTPKIVDLGIPRALETKALARERPFNPLSMDDLRLLGEMVQAYRDLDRVPKPY
ncbi:metallophosphoesterase [Pseudoxanthomonas composti]|uniref:Calcineurin-like phosphoesterase domain-containing protein n=1 Tax=Pseudoxanthomonas composti TaxID=2137479 RepID=A0A4Q1JX72_9GAMM|nr:metallophosphoesterase [Pseudoxanthomonas composti]RXR07261.1 hypothetical protein EPA99_04910 [Pseudoxanthomonas composti]